ncbi:MAG: hypothetical protein IMF10_02450 [Proteobacteria bacterium]|jgi:glucose-1-phosphate cytidylyltransferase|nr:hypothetical protein [Pseudomonadota bacterium]
MIDGNQVSEFFEKPKGIEGFVNCDLEYGPLEKIVSKGELMVYEHDGFWACMDTIREMEHLNKLWNDETAPWKIWSDVSM